METFKLLHDGVPRLADEPLSSITPTALLRKLLKRGIADGTVLEDEAEALRLGYRFAPLSAHFQAMFDVARTALDLPQRRVQDWFELSPDARAPWLQRADSGSNPEQALRANAALLLLEQAALRQQELLARDELKRRYLGGRARAGQEASDVAVGLLEFLQTEGYFSRPATLLPEEGYGLPQGDERLILVQAGSRYAAQLEEQGAALRAEARRWLSPQRRAALQDIEDNLAVLGERLRSLHMEQGGMRLR